MCVNYFAVQRVCNGNYEKIMCFVHYVLRAILNCRFLYDSLLWDRDKTRCKAKIHCLVVRYFNKLRLRSRKLVI